MERSSSSLSSILSPRWKSLQFYWLLDIRKVVRLSKGIQIGVSKALIYWRLLNARCSWMLDLCCQLLDNLVLLSEIKFDRFELSLEHGILLDCVVSLLFQRDCFSVKFLFFEAFNVQRDVMFARCIVSCHTVCELRQMWRLSWFYALTYLTQKAWIVAWNRVCRNRSSSALSRTSSQSSLRIISKTTLILELRVKHHHAARYGRLWSRDLIAQ